MRKKKIIRSPDVKNYFFNPVERPDTAIMPDSSVDFLHGIGVIEGEDREFWYDVRKKEMYFKNPWEEKEGILVKTYQRYDSYLKNLRQTRSENILKNEQAKLQTEYEKKKEIMRFKRLTVKEPWKDYKHFRDIERRMESEILQELYSKKEIDKPEYDRCIALLFPEKFSKTETKVDEGKTLKAKNDNA